MGLLQTLENIFTDVSNSTQISQDTRLLSNVKRFLPNTNDHILILNVLNKSNS